MNADMHSIVDNVKAFVGSAVETVQKQNARIQELESCLNRMMLAYENTLSDSEGKWPQLDSGCIDCTCGTVPDKFNTGPCAYHAAKRLLGQL